MGSGAAPTPTGMWSEGDGGRWGTAEGVEQQVQKLRGRSGPGEGRKARPEQSWGRPEGQVRGASQSLFLWIKASAGF